MRLFNRKAEIVVDLATRGPSAAATSLGVSPALRVPCGKDGFDCSFDIRRDLKAKPNRGIIRIFNLTKDHRDSLSERAAKGPVRARLEAGYEDGTSQIFAGDLRLLYHDRSGSDFVTVIESGDGDRLVSAARLSKSWARGTAVSTVIKDLTTALGIGGGNISSTINAAFENVGPILTGSLVVSGPALQELVHVCRSCGIDFSIQDGVPQFLLNDKALSATAVKVTGTSGLEGTIKIDHKGKLHVTTRIIPGIFPGRKIQLEDKSVWRVEKARYHGETRGHAWNIAIEAKAV